MSALVRARMILHCERMQDVQTRALRRQADRHIVDVEDRIVLSTIAWLSIGWALGSLATMVLQVLP